MKQEKKSYEAPTLTIHGSFEKITQQYGSDMTDVPFGTSSGVSGGVTGPYGS